MIVDNIESHCQTALVARIHKFFEAFRTSIRILRGERIDAVIAPVAIPRKLSDGHDLDSCYAQIFELIQVWDDGLKDALNSIGPHMDFIEHIIGERHSGPERLFPNKMGVNDLGWPMNALGLELGGWIGTLRGGIETINVPGSGLNLLCQTAVIAL
jgi:hypothetical protein